MNKFYLDRDTRGRVAEYLLLELLHSRGIAAELNPAPDPDDAPDEETRALWLQQRRAYDIWVAGEWWDVKVDWFSWRSHNVCIEAPTLQHTRSSRLCYLFPRPSSLYFHTFSVPEAIELYNAKVRYGEREGWRYPHKLVGKPEVPAVLPPREILQTHGMPLWDVCKIIKQQAA